MTNVLKSVYLGNFEKIPPSTRRFLTHLESRLEIPGQLLHDRKIVASPRLTRGAVTVSLDFELSWAWQYARMRDEDTVTKATREREQVPKILSRLEQCVMPVTWAIVGHLFLNSCTRAANGLAHPSLPRLQPFESKWWSFTGGDWYQHDPCTDVCRDPLWYAPDLIEDILASPVRHEIACHGFSHAGFGPYCPDEVADAELAACLEAMGRFGLRPTTMVFPGNVEGHYPILGRNGILMVRAPQVASIELGLPTQRSDGIWTVPVSTDLDSKVRWTNGQRLERLKCYVNRAAATRTAAHIWLHPSIREKEMLEIFFPFLDYCASQRDKGSVDLLTMEQLVRATGEARRGKRGKDTGGRSSQHLLLSS